MAGIVSGRVYNVQLGAGPGPGYIELFVKVGDVARMTRKRSVGTEATHLRPSYDIIFNRNCLPTGFPMVAMFDRSGFTLLIDEAGNICQG